MFSQMRLLDWLSLLNYEVVYRSRFQVVPWNRRGGRMISTHIPALGCLNIMVARKRTLPLTMTPAKNQRQSKTARNGQRHAPAAQDERSGLRLIADIFKRRASGGGARQLIAAFVFRMPGVTFYPFPFDLMMAERRIQPLPQVDVLNRLLIGGLPAALFQLWIQLVIPAQVLAVGAERHFTGLRQRFQRHDGRHHLHTVIGGAIKPALKVFHARDSVK